MRIYILAFCMFLLGCVTLDDTEPRKAPMITSEMSHQDLVKNGIEFGGITLKNAKTVIESQKAWREIEPLAGLEIITNYRDWNPKKLINAIHLYTASEPKDTNKFVSFLLDSKRPFAKTMGWRLAAATPSLKNAETIDLAVTSFIDQDDSNSSWLVPELAEAIAANEMHHLYSVLRLGLNETQHTSFARSMIYLNPVAAKGDFLAFLGRVPIQELRQLTMAQTNAITCVLILDFLEKNPVRVGDAKIAPLFNFAVSRNNAVATSSMKVLEKLFTVDREGVAIELSRAPTWIQVSFLDRIKRQMNYKNTLFLREFKGVASSKDVLDELQSIRF